MWSVIGPMCTYGCIKLLGEASISYLGVVLGGGVYTCEPLNVLYRSLKIYFMTRPESLGTCRK